MKAVMLSIQPKWCELIASGKKTVEVRKTRPQIETPFKCYIYCTHNNHKYALHTYINSGYGRANFGVIGNWRSGKELVEVNSHLLAYRYNAYLAEGKVIGEFVCNRLTYIEAGYDTNGNKHLYNTAFIEHRMCIPDNDLHEYLYKDRDHCGGWAWHISGLVIYDKPKELSEFYQNGKNGDTFYYDYCAGCPHHETPVGKYPCIECDGNRKYLYRPPQSWFYCEELKGE